MRAQVIFSAEILPVVVLGIFSVCPPAVHKTSTQPVEFLNFTNFYLNLQYT